MFWWFSNIPAQATTNISLWIVLRNWIHERFEFLKPKYLSEAKIISKNCPIVVDTIATCMDSNYHSNGVIWIIPKKDWTTTLSRLSLNVWVNHEMGFSHFFNFFDQLVVWIEFLRMHFFEWVSVLFILFTSWVTGNWNFTWFSHRLGYI